MGIEQDVTKARIRLRLKERVKNILEGYPLKEKQDILIEMAAEISLNSFRKQTTPKPYLGWL